MQFNDFLMILAVLFAPVIAVQVQKYLERQREAHERRLRIFKTLMGTRAAVLAPAHVEALNLIDVEFYGARRFKHVRDSWKCSGLMTPDTQLGENDRRRGV